MDEAQEKMAQDIEIIMAQVARLPVKTHINVLGDKWKYINALTEGLIALGYRKLQGKEGKMLKKLLIKLVMKAYKEGHRDERNRCEADDSFFEKLVEEIL